jgi:hypothetical protein
MSNTVMARRFIRSTCANCHEPFEVPEEYINSRIDCPHCKSETVVEIGASQLVVVPEPQSQATAQARARRVKKRAWFGWWSILEIFGVLLTIPFGLLFASGLVAVYKRSAAGGVLGGAELMFLLSVGIPFLIGCALWQAAHKFSLRWLCSNCCNRLTDREARVCAVCKCDLVS